MMKDIQDFYILGLPIETPLGLVHFLKVKDYPDYFGHLQAIALTPYQIIQEFEKNYPDSNQLELLKKASLYELVGHFQDIRWAYQDLFKKVINDDILFEPSTVEEFDYYRHLVMKMNYVREEKINPNPEIQKWIEKSKKFKENGEQLTFSDLVSSVVGYNGITYDYINEMTIYQLYMTFHRISQIKGYDTSTLFATVAEKVDIQSWCKHIDLFAEEQHGISRDEFDRKVGGIFGGN